MTRPSNSTGSENKTERTVPLSVYRRHVLRARSSKNTFTFSRDWLSVLGHLEGLFLQDLINRISAKKAKRFTEVVDGEEREYVLCTVRFLERFPGTWNRKVQTNMLKKLKKKGYVDVQFRGLPKKRYVWVDVVEIETDVDSAILIQPLQGLKCKSVHRTPTGVDCTTPVGVANVFTNVNTEEEDKERSNSRPTSSVGGECEDTHFPEKTSTPEVKTSRDGFNPPHTVHKNKVKKDPIKEELRDESTKLAIQLHDVLVNHGKLIGKRKVRIQSWAQCFADLLKVISFMKISSAIRQHDKHLDDPYWPQLYAANTFCGNFPRVQRAIDRLGEEEDAPPRVKVTYNGKIRTTRFLD